MILRALYDYYHRCGNLPQYGMELKQIGFLIVINQEGKFLRLEDCRTSKNSAKEFLVKKSVIRSSNPIANYLYDNSEYVFGYSNKSIGKDLKKFDIFKQKIESICNDNPNNSTIRAVHKFYQNNHNDIIASLQSDPLWEDVTKSLSKKYALFSFRIEGDTRIVAEYDELMPTSESHDTNDNKKSLCLVTGTHCDPVLITTATMIPGSQASAKLVAFQSNSGYDSYGKNQGLNAPISPEAEFAYTTALNHLLRSGSHNKFSVGTRTYVFWASSSNKACQQAEESLFDMLGFADNPDNPNYNIEKVKNVFMGIYTGKITTELNDRFFILGLAPNSARIAVAYWSELPLKQFAGNILQHFNDMEIIDTRNKKHSYTGLRNIISAVTLGGKQQDASPNLPDAIARSVFQATPYPDTLFASCIRRIRAEQDPTPYNSPCRIAILKAYLNRKQKENSNKLKIMLDTENNNPGYLCGRLFAVLDKIQEEANNINSLKERYMNSASSTPATVFATILNLSSHHTEKLLGGRKVYFEKLKQEIIDKLSANGFPAHLQLQDQGRFFIGYYHQRQEFFKSKSENENNINNK